MRARRVMFLFAFGIQPRLQNILRGIELPGAEFDSHAERVFARRFFAQFARLLT